MTQLKYYDATANGGAGAWVTAVVGAQGPQGAQGSGAAGALLAINNLSDVANVVTSKTNLGITEILAANYGVSISNSDNTTALRNAIAAANASPSGATIKLPIGQLNHSGNLDLRGMYGITLSGVGSTSQSYSTGTVLCYTGGGSDPAYLIGGSTIKGSTGIRFKDLTLSYLNSSSSTFTGNLVDLQSTVYFVTSAGTSGTGFFSGVPPITGQAITSYPGGCTVTGTVVVSTVNKISQTFTWTQSGSGSIALGGANYVYINGVNYFSSNGHTFDNVRCQQTTATGYTTATANAYINLNNSWDHTFNRLRCEAGAMYHVLGQFRSDLLTGVQNVVFRDNKFQSWGDGAGNGYSIYNSGSSWKFEGCNWEPAVGGYAGAYGHSANNRSSGLTIDNCWLGDVTAGTNAWITWSGDSLVVTGGTLLGAGPGTAIKIDESNCNGISVNGVNFLRSTIGIDFGSTNGHVGVFEAANSWSGVTTKVSYSVAPEQSFFQTGFGEPTVFTGGSSFGLDVTGSAFTIRNSGVTNLLSASMGYPTGTPSLNSTLSSVGTVAYDSTVVLYTPSNSVQPTPGTLKLTATSTPQANATQNLSIKTAGPTRAYVNGTVSLPAANIPYTGLAITPNPSTSPEIALIASNGGLTTTITLNSGSTTTGTYSGPAPCKGATIITSAGSAVGSGCTISTVSSGTFTLTGSPSSGSIVSGSTLTVSAYDDSVIQQITYTGVSGGNLTGCVGGTGTITTGQSILTGLGPLVTANTIYTAIASYQPNASNVHAGTAYLTIRPRNAVGTIISGATQPNGFVTLSNGVWTQVSGSGATPTDSTGNNVACFDWLLSIGFATTTGSQTVGGGSTLNLAALSLNSGIADTSGYASSGSFALYDNTSTARLITYTSKDTTHFYGCNVSGGGTYTIPSGSQCIIYGVPGTTQIWNVGGLQLATGAGATGWVAPGSNSSIGITLSGLGAGGLVVSNVGVPTAPTQAAQLAQVIAETARAKFAEALLAPLTSVGLSNYIIPVASNAGSTSINYNVNTFTNNSAASMTVTLSTTGAVDGQSTTVRVYDFSAVAQTITWVNTENSTVVAPVLSAGSTTLPKTVTFQYNAATSKWRCVASV